MTVFELGIYGGEAELVGNSETAVGDKVGFGFSSGVDGYLEIGRITKRLDGGIAVFERGELPKGAFKPTLTADGVRIALPAFISDGEGVAPAPLTDSEIRSISVRERELCKRVSELERATEQILARIDTKIKF